MKKYIAAVLSLCFVLSPTSVHAATSVELGLSAMQIKRGGEITLSGTVTSDIQDVAVKIISPSQTVFYVDHIAASNGKFSKTVVIPTNEDFSPYGLYRVVAGTGAATDTEMFSVVDVIREDDDDSDQNNNSGPITGPVAPPTADIPVSAGLVEGSLIKPELTPDGRALVGSETLSKALEQANGSVTIELPAEAGDKGTALEFPAKSLQEFVQKNAGLVLTSGSRTIRFPAGFMSAETDEKTRVRIVVNSNWSDTAKEAVLPSIQGKRDYKSTGVVLSVEIQVITGERVVDIHKLDKPAEVSMKLSDEQAKSIASDAAGVYYVNESQLEYVGGVVNNGVFTFNAEHFSYYTILEYNKVFTDLAGHWAEKPVKSLAAKHIVEGVDESHYEPNRSITRAEFVTLLIRAMDWTGKAPVKAASNPFSDVAASQYYTEQVSRAASLGIVSGYNGAFRPNDSITREEAVVALVNGVQYFDRASADKAKPPFADLAEISSWAASAVNEAWSTGLIEGDGVRFNPRSSVTRAEVAVMIQRLLPSSS